MDFKSRLIMTLKQHCDRTRNSCTLFNSNFQKHLGLGLVACYVLNLEHLFKNNIQSIFRASLLCEKDPKLSSYFRLKWDEEKGHDQWAKSDLAKILETQKVEFNPNVLPEMKNFVSFLDSTLLRDPLLYITYFFHAEYMTAYLGPDWMKIINSALGIATPEISALSKHIELDGGHAEEVIDFLIDYGLSSEQEDEIICFTGEIHEMYTHFFEALAREGCIHEISSARKSA